AKDQRHINESEDAEERAEQCAAVRLFDESAQQQIGNVKQPEHEGGSQARVPSPPDAPDGMRPDRSGDEDDGGEGEAHFGARNGEPIIFFGALPDIQEIADEADKEGGEAGPGAGHVKIENALDEA